MGLLLRGGWHLRLGAGGWVCGLRLASWRWRSVAGSGTYLVRLLVLALVLVLMRVRRLSLLVFAARSLSRWLPVVAVGCSAASMCKVASIYAAVTHNTHAAHRTPTTLQHSASMRIAAQHHAATQRCTPIRLLPSSIHRTSPSPEAKNSIRPASATCPPLHCTAPSCTHTARTMHPAAAPPQLPSCCCYPAGAARPHVCSYPSSLAVRFQLSSGGRRLFLCGYACAGSLAGSRVGSRA